MLTKFKNCQKITELVSLSYEEPLSATQKMEVQLHLAWCPHCRDFDDNTQMLKKIAIAHNHPSRDK